MVGSLTRQVDNGKRTLDITNQQRKTFECNPVTSNKRTSSDVYDFSLVRNDVASAEQAVETIPRHELLVSCEVPNSEVQETCKGGLNQDKIVDLASSYRGSLNWKETLVEVDQEVVNPYNQTAVVEIAESVFGSTSNSQNLNCEAGIYGADLDSLLENGHLNASGAFQNDLTKELEPNITLGKVVKSQDHARSETLQKPVISRLSLKSTT
ncbi:hypothetical protein SLA2020_006270 [Shorea laevis]